ncbi:MAG: hypothetical protein AAFO07_26020 [Bacteroidota bacterium]
MNLRILVIILLTLNGLIIHAQELSTYVKNNAQLAKIDVLFLDLNKANSPFKLEPYLINYKRGNKKMNVDPNSNTLDYIQYAILMQHSDANIPLESINDN